VAAPPPEAEEPSVDAPTRMPKDRKPKTTAGLKDIKPEPLPLAVPPGQRGRTMPQGVPPPTQLAVPPGQRGRNLPTATTKTPATAKTKHVIGNRKVTPIKTGAYGWIRPQEAALCVPLRDLILESVVKTNGESMSTINEAIKLVEEMEADELSHMDSGAPPTDMGVGSDIGGDTLEMSEPPMSDSAIGADTEGESALSLLRSMKNSLEHIAAAVAPIEEMPPGAEGPGGMGGGGMGAEGMGAEGAEGEEGLPMPDEPPSDLEAEAGAEEGEAAEEEGEAEEDEGEAKEDKKKAKAEVE